MIQSCIGQDFTILRQNSQILCKIHNKLENIISIHVWRWNGIKFGRGVVHNLENYISYYMVFFVFQAV